MLESEEDGGDDDGATVPDAWEMLAEPNKTVPTAAVAADDVESAKGNVDGGLGLEGVSLEEADAGGGGSDGVAKEAGERDEGDGRPAVLGGAEDAGAKVDEGAQEEGEVVEEEESASVMEERLVWAFLNGLKKTLKDKELPMLVRSDASRREDDFFFFFCVGLSLGFPCALAVACVPRCPPAWYLARLAR